MRALARVCETVHNRASRSTYHLVRRSDESGTTCQFAKRQELIPGHINPNVGQNRLINSYIRYTRRVPTNAVHVRLLNDRLNDRPARLTQW